jgi:hypothetical protein
VHRRHQVVIDIEQQGEMKAARTIGTRRNTRSRRGKSEIWKTSRTKQTVTVNYATANLTAQAGSDYTAKSGTVTFNPGTTTQTISVSVLADTRDESSEYFLVILSNPSNVAIANSLGLGAILNDD